MTLTKKRKVPSNKAEKIVVLDGLLSDIEERRKAVKILNEEIKDRQDEAIVLMEDLHLDKHSTKLPNGDTARAALVKSSTTVLDEERLKKKVGVALWNKVTSRVLDKAKLDAYVKSGDIKATVIADCITEKPRSPFIKITI